ncbi:MAG: hypothetical protein ACT4N2_01740 [Hyphomicrobium sp.]
MFVKRSTGMVLALSITAGAAVAVLAGPAGADDRAAHAIADKFSAAGKGGSKSTQAPARTITPKPDAGRAAVDRKAADRVATEREQAAKRARAEELDMLERARAEAAARDREAREHLARQREAEERETARRQAEAEKARLAAEDEARRVAEQARIAAETRQRAEQEAAERMEAERKAAEKQAEEQRLAAEQAQREARRQEEARQLADKHNRLRVEREQAEKSAAVPLPPLPPAPLISSAPDDSPAAGRNSPLETRVTVLLVLDPGDRGIRRFEKTADPILCLGANCFVSSGSALPSLQMPRIKAFGAGNTLGRRAGSCRHKLACAFRGVDINAETAALQPIDLRIMRHDRREVLSVRADRSCDIDQGRLACGEPARARTWRAWIVPEHVAERAGPKLLEAALAAGLPDGRSAFSESSEQ